MVEHLRQQRESEEIQQILIAADAPLEMMQTLFGLSPREYSQLRRMLSVDQSVGRPRRNPMKRTHTGSGMPGPTGLVKMNQGHCRQRFTLNCMPKPTCRCGQSGT